MRTNGDGSRRRRRFTAEDRRRLVTAWRRSGESQNQFAQEHGIGASYLSRWKEEFPADDAEEEASPARLVPVHVIESAPARLNSPRDGFELRLPSGVEVSIPADFDRDRLLVLLDALGCSRC